MRGLPIPSRTGFLRLFAFFGAAVAWMTHLLVSWSMVPLACQSGYGWLHLATVLAVAVSLAAIAAALKLRSYQGEATEQSEMLAYLDTLAVWMSALFLFAILMAAAANFWLSACDRSFGL